MLAWRKRKSRSQKHVPKHIISYFWNYWQSNSLNKGKYFLKCLLGHNIREMSTIVWLLQCFCPLLRIFAEQFFFYHLCEVVSYLTDNAFFHGFNKIPIVLSNFKNRRTIMLPKGCFLKVPFSHRDCFLSRIIYIISLKSICTLFNSYLNPSVFRSLI